MMEVALKGRAKRRHLNAEELARSAEGVQVLIHPLHTTTTCNLQPGTTAKRRKCGGVSSYGQQSAEDSTEEEDWSPAAEERQSDPEEMDYLEGITAEMFDDEFDGSDGTVPEVEPLPDATYGLLGSSKELQQPRGHIHDLPEEVLSQVLSLLPAQDLYRSAVLVCQRWRNMVEDGKFMPYKKRYYRYMMEEEDTVYHVTVSLKNCGILLPAVSPLGIRNLVISMAHHRFGERVHPEDVLGCVKKHRLFPHAEASIRLRIRNVPKCKHLETEAPNPFAAMAVILLLAESVADVQTLVSLLSGVVSHLAITEYLSHMAMVLLAAKRNRVKISDRLHYNIYYVLHLMENGPFYISASPGRAADMTMTSEQLQILSHHIQKEHTVKIVAFAGTGKTTTLVKYAEQRPHLRFLYAAFNKSVAREASQRFPRNVDCKTVHSLAYGETGRMYQKKLAFNLNAFSINGVLPKGRGGFTRSKLIANTLNNFMASTDETITVAHVPANHVSLRRLVKIVSQEEKLLYVQEAQRIWSKMKDVKETDNRAYHMVHDGYLKLWQLKGSTTCLSDQYDVLLIDEAQDCTPTIMDVLLKQKCAKMVVGDPHQQIYTFRGAVDALTTQHTHIYYLTQSFRFGAEIAYVGATILKVCKKVHKILVGGRQEGGVFDDKAAQAAQDVASGKTPGKGTSAILSRCNLTMFSEAVRLTEVNTECSIHFVGGVDNMGLSKIKDIWYLMEGKDNRKCESPLPVGEEYIRSFFSFPLTTVIKDHLVWCFSRIKKEDPFEALKTYAEHTNDRDLESKLSIVEKYRCRIPDLVKRLNKHSEPNAKNADFILSTVHKAKGLEFDTVMVTDDFVDVPCSSHYRKHFNFSFDQIPSDEWNLLYVAVTRAKRTLIITKNIRRIITYAGEYFLKSQMPGPPPLQGDQTPPCMDPTCLNCLTPGAAFTMHKRTMTFTGSVESTGGPLCERCVWTRVGLVAYLMTDDVTSMAVFPPGPFFPVVLHMPF
ncbi:F-box DNA helicase 1 isoform X2 [Entelurus aequoreus]|uniref:F-box DNA helicase 1 isoform X2 n=1 Tax=Entelurus aequoreus TaxID=161455 RepID=UPI002B1E4AA7|nr:F-box DNA helicase 1 isoform X2 [Entelurus aequoreus]